MSTLERAIAISAQAHTGQVDKAGSPYILHPLRVMMRLHSEEERIVGVLHDVLEDTSVTVENLRAEGFSEEVLTALLAVTKIAGEEYEDFVRRAARNPIAKNVKMADLLDNSDLGRLSVVTPKDHERVLKYRRAIAKLQGQN